MYSLGVVLLDMFRNHDCSFHELNLIHEAMLRGQVETQIAKRLPPTVVQLIERLIKRDPNERPSAVEALTR